MTYQDKPIATIRAALKTLLETNVPTGVKVYDHMPTLGVQEPCVVLQNISGSGREAAVGEAVGSDVKGHEITVVFQFDVYHTTDTGRDEVADKVLYAIWKNRASLKSQNKVEYSPPRRIQDLPPGDAGERLYRKSMDIPFSIMMTAEA